MTISSIHVSDVIKIVKCIYLKNDIFKKNIILCLKIYLFFHFSGPLFFTKNFYIFSKLLEKSDVIP